MVMHDLKRKRRVTGVGQEKKTKFFEDSQKLSDFNVLLIMFVGKLCAFKNVS